MLNLAGGGFSANAACRGGNNGGVISRDMSKVYVNFNGGTYRTRADTGGVGGRGLFGHAIGGVDGANTWVDYVTIYSGGATIETDKSQRKVYIHTPLRAPVGKGVASVDFSAYRGKRTGLTAPPAVVIDGDGEGASAYAVFDVETGSITGVRVVSPGWGYTTATARFYSGNVGNFNVCPVTLADTVPGGLTKAGAGSLYLNAENTYTGETVLKGGALHLVCSGALPAESTVAYEGGELKSTAAAFPSAIKVRIPGAENGSVRRCDLATFTDSCPDALPEVEVVNVPENVKPRWVAGFRGLILYVKRFAGSVISFR
jgi:autotransporter-associated beta strand protein